MPQARRMKNVNIFVDVDLTLIDEREVLMSGAVEALRKLKARGCHLYVWSTRGVEGAREIVKRCGIEELIEGIVPKPDIIIDDMPGTCLNPFVFDVNQEESWEKLAKIIVDNYVA
jgi:hypothetical protein